MPTFNQLVKQGRQKKTYKSKTPAMQTGFNTIKNKPIVLQATRRTWKANLQKVRIKDEDGRIIRVYVSTRALRTGAKNGTIERA